MEFLAYFNELMAHICLNKVRFSFTFCLSQPMTGYSMQIIDPLLTARESAGALQISVPTFYRRVADGTVPKPIRIGALARWPQSEIEAVITAAKALRCSA
ncbi:hypothetical protein D3C80_906110 [compost metagenome]